MASRKFFSVAEVERLIPALEKIFSQALQLRIALRAQELRLERAGVRISRDVLEADDSTASYEVRHAKSLFRGCYEALSDQLACVEKLGGEVKDLEIGLVDFPGRRGDEEICLCWKLGEQRIAFWHTVEGGYSSRRPIDDQVPHELPRLD
jgi:hypothetical protein